jgi:inner membrane protein YidH
MTSDSHFAWLRTRLALDRTLMAWVRTATAMIGFGFTIVQFFERLETFEGVAPALRPQAPRFIGLALIGAGILSLAVSIWQYRWVINYMWREPFKPLAGIKTREMHVPVYALAILVTLIGVFAFVAILTRAI